MPKECVIFSLNCLLGKINACLLNNFEILNIFCSQKLIKIGCLTCFYSYAKFAFNVKIVYLGASFLKAKTSPQLPRMRISLK